MKIRKFGDMAIRKTKLNRGLLLFKSKPKSCVANQTTLRLSLQFKTNPVLCKRKRGAKIKGKKSTNIYVISLQIMMTERAKSIKNQTPRDRALLETRS